MVYYPHNRITIALDNTISNSLFEFFCYDTGGAIQISSSGSSLSLKSSLFRFCISMSYGGAIFHKGQSTIIHRTCFDTCFISGSVNDIFGNAIYSNLFGSSGEPSSVDQSSFFACAPESQIACDSTVCFDGQTHLSENTNFTHCCGYGGPTTISIINSPGTARYISSYGGFAFHLTYILRQTFSLQSANFLNFSQTTNTEVFYGYSTIVTDCVLFISILKGGLGSVTFSGNCVGNVSFQGITTAEYSEIPLSNIPADGYCRQNDESFFNSHRTNLHILLVFINSIIW